MNIGSQSNSELIKLYKEKRFRGFMFHASELTDREIFLSCMEYKNNKMIFMLKDRLSIFNIISIMFSIRFLDKIFFKNILLYKKKIILSSVSRKEYKTKYYVPITKEVFKRKRNSFITKVMNID